jgi:hypothetical protein
MRVLEMECLRRIFGTTRMNVTGERKKLHNEDFYNLHSSPNIIRVINSMRMIGYGLDM